MKTIGHRQLPPIHDLPSGPLLVEGASFNRSLVSLAPASYVPKGVYRFASHEAMNRQDFEWVARAMARLHQARR